MRAIALCVFSVGMLTVASLATWVYDGLPAALAQPLCATSLIIAVAAGLVVVMYDAKDARRAQRLSRLARELGDSQKCDGAFGYLLQLQEAAVPLFIEALQSSAGVVHQSALGTFGGKIVYEGNLARSLAAEGLGHVKSPAAVPALLTVLNDEDVAVRTRAVWALGEIGDAKATGPLVSLLGEATLVAPIAFGGHRQVLPVGPRTMGELAAHSLRKCGEAELATAFLHVLKGNRASLPTLRTSRRPELIAALIDALDHPSAQWSANAAWALGELGATEALPRLMAKQTPIIRMPAVTKRAYTEAVAKLQKMSMLPRPAATFESSMETLPRSTNARPTTHSLPRVANGGNASGRLR